MFLTFDHTAIGFNNETWEEVPRIHKIIIRDWLLHKKDTDATMMYNYYETDSTIRKAIAVHELKKRCESQNSLAAFSFLGS